MKYYNFPTKQRTNNSIQLVLPAITDDELPKVSIVTPTYNRPEFINLMLRNYNAIDYPRDKLEWIIVDDSPNFIDYSVLQKVGAKVYRVPNKLKLGRKRNFINCLTKYNYIVHLDDDDFYPSYSVISRIRTLLEQEKKNNNNINCSSCVACRVVDCYDLITDKTFEAYDLLADTISESTLAYSKQFWKERPFNNDDTITECISFIGDRTVCIIPSSFVITQLTHNNNTITRRPDANSSISFLDRLTMQDHNIINELKSKIILKLMASDIVFKEALEFVRNVKSSQEPLKKAIELFDELEYKSNNDVLKHPLVLNLRRSLLILKKKSTGKDIVYYCGPSNLLKHENEWSPESKSLGGSEEAVVYLSEEFVKAGFSVTVYNTVSKQKRFNGVLYKPYWLWNPNDVQDLTIIWRDPNILKEVPHIESKKIFIDMHDAIPVNNTLQYNDSGTIFVKSNFHASFVNAANDIVVVPNGIKTNDDNDFKVVSKDPNIAICTSSPDRCLTSLLNALPIIRQTKPDFKVFWAYGFASGINKGGLSENKDPKVVEWITTIKEQIKNTEGFVDLGRLSQEEVIEYYKKAKYFIYGTNFPEIDCISLTKALYYNCIPLVAGCGSVAEKLKKLEIEFVETNVAETSVIDSSLQKDDTDFDKWISLITDNLKYDNLKSHNKKINMSKEIEENYNWTSIAEKWIYSFALQKKET
jgi:glycosyltransferase involved in cell wall biosynthesis